MGEDWNASASVDLGKEAEFAVNIIITSYKTIKFPVVDKAITGHYSCMCSRIGVVALKDKHSNVSYQDIMCSYVF